MIQAIWNNEVIAESDDTIIIEGNHYFPPESVKKEYFTDSTRHTVCPWKGQADYFDIDVEGSKNPAAAWTYPSISERANSMVGQDFAGYVAFWHGVQIKEA